MRSTTSRIVIAFVITVVLIGGVSTAHSQSQDDGCRYFPETGHHVCDAFLEFFTTWGGLEIFGYPLTEQFEDARLGGRPVQYFQRARMELHSQGPGPGTVVLGALVDELGYSFPPVRPEQIPAFNDDLHEYFPETGHVVAYAFLYYFREKGGLKIFGYPRSEAMFEDGYIVQYFQRARMEWHPESSSHYQMRLTNLGEICLERFDVPEDYIKPRDPNGIIVEPGSPGSLNFQVTQLKVSATVRHIITGQAGVQTVFVFVNDQWRQPVEGAAVEMVVHYQSGDQRYSFAPTDERGFTSHSFELIPAAPGRRVVIDVTVAHGSVRGATQTFFLPWW